MVQARTSAKEFFNADERLADLGLIAVPGAEELTAKIDRHLLRWAQEAGMDQDTFIIESECPRFSSGDGKGLIRSTVRGDDIYFVVDVGNYNQKYKIFGHENFMSPDDHFQNLKRLIQATSSQAHERHYAAAVRQPPAPPRLPGKSGLRRRAAGAAGHGHLQHRHL